VEVCSAFSKQSFKANRLFQSTEDVQAEVTAVKKVNSQVNIDEKTGKVVSAPASVELTNGDCPEESPKHSNSLPDLPNEPVALKSSSSNTTLSSISNNQSSSSSGISHGKHVILAVPAAEQMNQIDGATNYDAHTGAVKKKIKLNIELNDSNASSSSTSSSNNLETSASTL